MTNEMMKHTPDPSLDLVLERIVDVPRELVWQAWTKPEEVVQWFTPKPWTTALCEIDLRPGGAFRTVMKGPDGEEFDGKACYLEIVENEKLVWTSMLGPGYRPKMDVTESGAFPFTAVITFEEHNGGTKYTALVIHGDEESREKHAGMGFEHGWGAAFDQLIEMIKARG